MAWEIPVQILPFQAQLEMSSSGISESTSNGQYRVMKSSQAGFCQTQRASTGTVVGVLQNAPISSEGASVMTYGVTKVWVTSSAAAIVSGGMLTHTTNGGVMPQNASTINDTVGIALQACSSGPFLISMLLTPGAGFSTASLPV